MTDFDKLKEAFDEIRIPYTLTDDSHESGIDDPAETVIEVKADDNIVLFLFRRSGEFKEICVF
jgi:hypothetical protein